MNFTVAAVNVTAVDLLVVNLTAVNTVAAVNVSAMTVHILMKVVNCGVERELCCEDGEYSGGENGVHIIRRMLLVVMVKMDSVYRNGCVTTGTSKHITAQER